MWDGQWKMSEIVFNKSLRTGSHSRHPTLVCIPPPQTRVIILNLILVFRKRLILKEEKMYVSDIQDYLTARITVHQLEKSTPEFIRCVSVPLSRVNCLV